MAEVWNRLLHLNHAYEQESADADEEAQLFAPKRKKKSMHAFRAFIHQNSLVARSLKQLALKGNVAAARDAYLSTHQNDDGTTDSLEFPMKSIEELEHKAADFEPPLPIGQLSSAMLI